MVLRKLRREGGGALVEGDDDVRVHTDSKTGKLLDGVVLCFLWKFLLAHDVHADLMQCLQLVEAGNAAVQVDEVAVTATVVRKLEAHALKHDGVCCE